MVKDNVKIIKLYLIFVVELLLFLLPKSSVYFLFVSLQIEAGRSLRKKIQSQCLIFHRKSNTNFNFFQGRERHNKKDRRTVQHQICMQGKKAQVFEYLMYINEYNKMICLIST